LVTTLSTGGGAFSWQARKKPGVHVHPSKNTHGVLGD
jgi:hypothetical protein